MEIESSMMRVQKQSSRASSLLEGIEGLKPNPGLRPCKLICSPSEKEICKPQACKPAMQGPSQT